jgi:hypothetical protein
MNIKVILLKVSLKSHQTMNIDYFLLELPELNKNFIYYNQRRVQVMSYKSLDKQVQGNHYQDFKIQPAEEGNAIKYICRHSRKGKHYDIKKAIHYLEMILERDYGEFI